MRPTEVDLQILAHLRQDARISLRALAARVGVSTPTASARVRALEAMGVIRGWGADIDETVLGRTLHVLELEAVPARAAEIATALARVPGLHEIVETEGGRFFARHVGEGTHPTAGLVEALAKLEGVTTYRLHRARQVAQGEAAPLPEGLALRVPCHLCKGPIEGKGIHRRWEADGRREHWFCCATCADGFGARLAALARGASSDLDVLE